MKIIFYSKNKYKTYQLKEVFKDIPLDYKIDNVMKLKNFIALFNSKNVYDFIIIDVDGVKAKKIKKMLDYIKEIKRNQKVIILGNKFDCKELYTCNFCRKNYNNIVLVEPINSQDLIFAITNINNCNKIDKNLTKSIKLILSNTNNYEFDLITNTIVNKNSFIDNRYHGLQDITFYLEEENIKYNIDKLQNIVLSQKLKY